MGQPMHYGGHSILRFYWMPGVIVNIPWALTSHELSHGPFAPHTINTRFLIRRPVGNIDVLLVIVDPTVIPTERSRGCCHETSHGMSYSMSHPIGHPMVQHMEYPMPIPCGDL